MSLPGQSISHGHCSLSGGRWCQQVAFDFLGSSNIPWARLAAAERIVYVMSARIRPGFCRLQGIAGDIGGLRTLPWPITPCCRFFTYMPVGYQTSVCILLVCFLNVVDFVFNSSGAAAALMILSSCSSSNYTFDSRPAGHYHCTGPALTS